MASECSSGNGRDHFGDLLRAWLGWLTETDGVRQDALEERLRRELPDSLVWLQVFAPFAAILESWTEPVPDAGDAALRRWRAFRALVSTPRELQEWVVQWQRAGGWFAHPEQWAPCESIAMRVGERIGRRFCGRWQDAAQVWLREVMEDLVAQWWPGPGQRD